MADQQSDEDRWRNLMIAAQSGNRTAYATLLTNITPMIRSVVRRRFRYLGQENAEDILQEVLQAVHSARRTYDPGRPFLPWLVAIAHNRAVDALRKISRRASVEMAVDAYPETFDPAGTNILEDAYRDPEALRIAVAELPEGQRKAIEMLKYRELSLKEAAAESGMSVAALKVAVYRATRSYVWR